MLYGANGNVLLTGDCSYKQVSSILALEIGNVGNCPLQIMVAPHHGGSFSKDLGILTMPRNVYIPQSAIISVDEAHNTYGHPAESVIRGLCLNYKEIKRTDIDGYI